MTQKVIDNAAAISLDTETTIAQTISNGRKLKWFRKGPIQWISEVQMNVMFQETYREILGSIQANLLGPYDIKFPKEVTGAASSFTITVNGGSQTGTTVNITSTPSTVVLKAGSCIQFNANTQVFVCTTDVSTNASGEAEVTLNYPLSSSPAAASTVLTGNNCVFKMHLVDKPTASFGPTGLVNHDGPFRFAEEVV